VVIGVHTPEFAFEKNVDNVKQAVADLKIGFPVAIDNNYAIWRAFKNRYWPADYSSMRRAASAITRSAKAITPPPSM
jgi:predicted dehydrogenase